MDRRAFLAATASTTLVAVAGCSGDDGGDSGGDSGGDDGDAGDGSGTTNVASAPESATEVSISGTSFEPLRQEVEPGSEIVWTNNDDHSHNLEARAFHDAAEEWSIDSTPVDPGDTVSHTFEESGVYEYFCAIHGQTNMCGVVLVGDVSLEEELPCEGTSEVAGTETDDETEDNESDGNETDGGDGNETDGGEGGDETTTEDGDTTTSGDGAEEDEASDGTESA